jgi:hypothetical protein
MLQGISEPVTRIDTHGIVVAYPRISLSFVALLDATSALLRSRRIASARVDIISLCPSINVPNRFR